MDGKLAATAALVRTFNNHHIKTQVRNLLKMGLGRVYVVVNNHEDKEATAAWLWNFRNEARVVLIPMDEGYSWANALNRGLAEFQTENLIRTATRQEDLRFLFPVSVEARFERAHIEAMLDVVTDETRLAIVGTTFEGRAGSNQISLGASYRHPRNTGMVIDISKFGPIAPFFDSACDAMGGMEDIDYTFRVLVMSGLTTRMLDLKVPLVVDVHWDQAAKEVRERAAMAKIIARARQFAGTSGPYRDAVERVIAEMRLED